MILRIRVLVLLASGLLSFVPAAHADGAMRGRIVTEAFDSTILRENLTGLNTRRTLKVYLPPGYESSGKAYPVVYYCHNINWSVPQMFEDGNLVRLIEAGFARGVVREFIFVATDYSTPTMGSLFENSPVSGRWLDYTTREIVPLIDSRFRTLRRPESRAVAGDFMGGRGALALAILNPDVFGITYALHPVATGEGKIPWSHVDVNWRSVHAAKRVEDLPTTGRERIFVMIHQGFLPNPERPPLYCDFSVEEVDGELRPSPENIRKTKAAFLLDSLVNANVAKVRRLRAIGLDWGRYDTTQAHVDSNQVFSVLLENLGATYEAEEYAGTPWNKTWTPDGRFATRLLPFLDRHLVFATD